ncbi:MAG: hypothetical protein ACLFTA_01215 [Candidatus Nanohaloarchaea archaeon]
MNPEKVFKRYDIRGEYPEEIDERFGERLGKSLALLLTEKFEKEVSVCRDAKQSSKPLKKALIKGLKSSGVKVYDAGNGPTDYAAWTGKKTGCVSVQVTSSHMPSNFNGFKMMYPEGNSFVNEDLDRVKEFFRSGEFERGDAEVEEMFLIEKYKEEVLKFAEKYYEKGNSVVYSSMGGSGSVLPDILDERGQKVLDVSPSELKNPPNPKPENLDLEKKVEKAGADIGIANDLDADRITVYFDGEYLSGDELFCVLAQLFEGKVVASIDAVKGLEEFADVEYTRVGDPFVLEKAVDSGSVLAGEPNGHYAFTNFVPYSSGVAAGIILSGLDLEKKLGKVPNFEVERRSVEVDDKNKALNVVEAETDDEKVVSRLDGLKFVEDGVSVLVRPSGSSSRLRAVASSRDGDVGKVLESIVEMVEGK